MILLSQRDHAWSGDHLGASDLTVGRYGCTTSCLSMLSDYFKCYINPKQLAHNAANYTKDGLILWNELKFDHMKFVWREYTRNDSRIQEALKDPDKAVMLQVDNKQHWVVPVRKTVFTNSYIVADPWYGAKVDVIRTYKNITGAAYFERK